MHVEKLRAHCSYPKNQPHLLLFSLMLMPLHKRIPRTWTSVILWPVRRVEMLGHRKSRSVHASQMFTKSASEASPSYTVMMMGASAAGYAVHEISDIHVRCSRMVKVHLGPGISVRGLTVLTPHRCFNESVDIHMTQAAQSRSCRWSRYQHVS